MSLDVFAPAIAAADQNVVANAAPDLPAGFSEAWDISTRAIGEWQGFGSYNNARERAMATYIDDVKQKTGETLPLYQQGGAVTIDEFNLAQAKLKEKYPGLDYLAPLSDDSVNAMTLARMKKAHDDNAAFSNRETTWGGTAGTVLGTLAAGISDPINLATLPLGGAGEIGIALRALEFAAISGGSEAITAASNVGVREAAVPGSSKEIPGEIAVATMFGGALGAGFGALGKLLGHGAKPLPTSVRDEVNAATSEFQFHATNPFPTAAGEAAARDATVDATTALAKGETVNVADGFDGRHVADYALAAKADTPEALALAGERHLRPETIGEVPNVERFDAMPSAADDAASYWEQRIAEASPVERRALGATDADLPQKPNAPQLPDRVQIGPASFDTTPVSGKSLWHETSPESAARLLEDDMTNSVDRVRRASIFVADNRDIAIGQAGRGVHIEFNGDLVSAVEHKKPGTGGLAGREYQANAIGNGAVQSIEVAPGETLRMKPSWQRRLDAEFDRSVLPDGTVRYERKGSKADVIEIAARDVTPEQVAKLAADPATESSVLHNLEHIMADKPEMDFSVQVRQADGSYQQVTRKLSDVLAEIDGMEAAAKEIEACAVGLAMAAE